MFDQKAELEKEIGEIKSLIDRNSEYAEWDKETIGEFREIDPPVADIYRYWLAFHLDKVAYLESRLSVLNIRLLQN